MFVSQIKTITGDVSVRKSSNSNFLLKSECSMRLFVFAGDGRVLSIDVFAKLT